MSDDERLYGLKLCPFCGREAYVKINHVECGSCNARSAKYNNSSNAIISWNKRTNDVK